MKDFNFLLPISVIVFSLDGDIILDQVQTWINPSHLKLWLMEQLYKDGYSHVFLKQDETKFDFVQCY